MQQAGHHQANLVAQQIKEDINHHLEARDSQVFSMLQSFPDLASSCSGSSTQKMLPQVIKQMLNLMAHSLKFYAC